MLHYIFSVHVLFYYQYAVQSGSLRAMKSFKVTIQIKAIDQHSSLMLFSVLQNEIKILF